jgi:hypothetical protein
MFSQILLSVPGCHPSAMHTYGVSPFRDSAIGTLWLHSLSHGGASSLAWDELFFCFIFLCLSQLIWPGVPVDIAGYYKGALRLSSSEDIDHWLSRE